MKGSDRKPGLTSYDDLFATDESRREAQQEHVQQVALRELHPFKDHPFRVVDDERMMETVESVKEYGVLVPLIVRPMDEGGYEIVSGHRRKRACELAGIDEIPVIVRNLDDDEAVIIMVDANLQRENILPSERAKAYQMKLEAIKRRAGRPSKDEIENRGQLGHHFDSRKGREIIADEAGDSPRNVQRYIRLNHLEQSLRDKVDHGELAFTPAVELSYLKPQEQQWFQAALETTQQTPSLSQAQRLKKASKEGTLSEEGILEIMSENKQTVPSKGSIIISEAEQDIYFPGSYPLAKRRKVIFRLLDNWLRHRQREQER